MVRVGGGWDTLEHFISRHDPNKIGRILTCKLLSLQYKIITLGIYSLSD